MIQHLPANHRVHWHCYTGTSAIAQKFVKHFPHGFIGVSPLITRDRDNRAHQVRAVVKAVDYPKLVFETDAPYFVPQAVRDSGIHQCEDGHPALAVFVGYFVAALVQQPMEAVFQAARRNTCALYSLPLPQ